MTSNKKFSIQDGSKVDDYSQFKQSLEYLYRDYHQSRRLHRVPIDSSDDRTVRLRLSLDLVREILVILTRIDEEMITLRKLEVGIEKNWRTGEHSPTSMMGKLITQRIDQMDKLKIDMKSLFQWVYMLDDTLSIRGGSVMPLDIRTFRNIFIVHFPNKSLKNKRIERLTAASLFHPARGLQLIFCPMFGAQQFEGFNLIEAEVKQYIPEILNESNLNEKVRIIWENFYRLPTGLTSGSTSNDSHFFSRLSQYGSRSPSLTVIMEALVNVWENKIKKLYV